MTKRKKVMIDNIAIGKRIREEREKLGLSREEFAEFTGFSNYYIGQLERGERQMSLPAMVNIARCLHLSLDYLIFGKTATGDRLQEAGSTYEAGENKKDCELLSLLDKCSPKELAVIEKIIKIILPYIEKE